MIVRKTASLFAVNTWTMLRPTATIEPALRLAGVSACGDDRTSVPDNTMIAASSKLRPVLIGR
jgi:hypothetical protein